MNYIIFDMEWNQPSTPEEKSSALRHGEIIQIGFFVLSERLEILYRDKVTVRPVVYPTMNEYVSELTGITQERAERGLPFPEGFSKMTRYFEDETVLLAWGDDDLPILTENMAFHRVETELPPHYNLQRIFCTETRQSVLQIGLKTAAEYFSINTSVRVHDALNDAYITLLIARRLDLSGGIRRYRRKSASPKRPDLSWLTEEALLTDETDYFGSVDGMAAYCGTFFTDCPICGKGLGAGKFYRFQKNGFVTKLRCPDDGDFFAHFEKSDDHLKGGLYPMTPSLEKIYTARIRHRAKNERYRQFRRRTAHLERK
ncbi:MAG: exonuclease domain-containing protein [Bacteroides sp.]|nr:exonuclease domain-containing protein [Eubacterium sp.]MCM1418299.1 exonuclease domain-containing protein [Roseburia sp.]MCM1462402.1 exonuclease domain-containing protein [Bacteroides sp.]